VFRTMKFEQGLSARLAAGVDNWLTRFSYGEPDEMRGIDPSVAERTHVNIPSDALRTVFHPRGSGESVLVEMPNGLILEDNEDSIVHIYDKDQFVERKRLKDRPQGFIVYEPGSDEASKAFMRAVLADRKFYNE
jgi:hypothetical protein